MGDVCRACDGRKERTVEDRDNCMKSTTKMCSRCNGTGVEPGPSKGKRRFGRKPKDDEDENPSIEEMTRAFLRRHGK